MSDLTNFNIYKENAGMFAGIDVLNPLAGNGSLLMHRNGQAFTKINLARSIAPRAFTSGVARFYVGGKVQLIQSDQVGFAFQQSQEDLTGGVGSAYLACLVLGTNGSNSSLQLFRCSAGLGTQTNLGTGTTFNAVLNTPIAVEITWILDIAQLGGIKLTLKHGTALDFTGLVTDVNIVSTTTVLQTSVAEGPYMKHNLSSSNGQYLFETASTDVYPLLIGA